MPIKAVVGDVGHAALEPSMHILVARVHSLVPAPIPMHLVRLALEELSLVLDRISVKRVVVWIDEVVRADLVGVPDVGLLSRGCSLRTGFFR